MEKDIDRITKSHDTDIVIRIDDFGGRLGLTIREFVKSEKYTGFTKSGLRIPADKFAIFKKAINAVDEKDLQESSNTNASNGASGSSLGNKDKQKEIEEKEF